MSANESHAHDSAIKTPAQLITVVVLSFVVPIFVIVMLAQFVTGSKRYEQSSSEMTPEAVAGRIKPVAEITLGATGPGGKTVMSGEDVFKSTCIACHGTGINNAPKFGSKAAWAPHLARGVPTLYTSALKGKGPMPARGGNASLSDAEVKAAVDYMVGAVK
jgi:cytochrome c5